MKKDIVFNAVDNGVFQTMSNLDKKSQELFKSMVETAQKSASSSKEQTKLINEQIAALERKARLERDETFQSSREVRDNQIFDAQQDSKGIKDPKQREEYVKQQTKEARDEYRASMENARDEYQESKLKIDSLKDQVKLLTKELEEQFNRSQESQKEQVENLVPPTTIPVSEPTLVTPQVDQSDKHDVPFQVISNSLKKGREDLVEEDSSTPDVEERKKRSSEEVIEERFNNLSLVADRALDRRIPTPDNPLTEEEKAQRDSEPLMVPELSEEEKQAYQEQREQTKLLGEQLRQNRRFHREQTENDKRNSEGIEDEVEDLGNEQSDKDKAKESLGDPQEDKKDEGSESEDSGSNTERKKKEQEDSTVRAITRYALLDRLVNSARAVSNTQNGVDGFQATSHLVSSTLGMGIGMAAKSNPIGIAASILVPGLMDTVTDLLLRSVTTQEEILSSKFRTRALTGRDLATSDLKGMGLDFAQVAQVQTEVARRNGSTKNNTRDTDDILMLEKGYGIDRNISMGILDLRQNQDLIKLAGGILKRGEKTVFQNGDRTFLPEFLGKFTSLQKELLTTNTKVTSGLVTDTMLNLSSLGGMYNIKDPRSMALYSSINQGLASPGSDGGKAFLYSTLRDMFPNEGAYDLKVKMSQGLGTSGYLKNVLKGLDDFGGDDQTKMFLTEGLFSGLPPEAIRTLVQNKDKIINGQISDKELQGMMSRGTVQSQAEMNTTEMEKMTAAIKNGFAEGIGPGLKEIGHSITETIKMVFSGAEIQMSNGKMIIPRSNPTKKPGKDASVGDIFTEIKNLF